MSSRESRHADPGRAQTPSQRHRADGRGNRNRRRAPPGRSRPGEPLAYDSLILACGAETSYFGHDDWRRPIGLKTLEDAVALRNAIFGAFEEAERATGGRAADWLTFVVVGGGPTGVEIAAKSRSLPGTRWAATSGGSTRAAPVTLVDAGERVSRLRRAALGKGGEGPRCARGDPPGGGEGDGDRQRGITVEIGGSPERIQAER